MSPYSQGMYKAADVLGLKPESLGHVADLAGLGLMSIYPAYHLYQDFQNDTPKGEHALELAGLGLLAAPTAAKILHAK